jgi:MYXO-CTERM domain-containing protein
MRNCEARAFARRTLSFVFAGLVSWSATAWADGEGGGVPDPPPDGGGQQTSDSGLSETQTQYTGAVMLRGGEDITFDSVVPGYVGDESYQQDGRYAYFAGNTLYAGVQDDSGNYVDMIAEFFWFESSQERGSDFYVGVVKARTSPDLSEWVLERQGNELTNAFLPDQEATLYLRAQTDVAQGAGSFRWDWSIPFDNYGWDAYGNITMNTAYGISLDAEGSAQKALNGEIQGIPAEANVQAKGFFNTEYKVQTQYEVTLWRWEVLVHGSAGQIDWQMNLRNKDREKQNAYHEFFIVMQADEGVPFQLDWLEVGGAVKRPMWYWFDERRALSSAVTGLTLRQPPMPDKTAPGGGFGGVDDGSDDNAETPSDEDSYEVAPISPVSAACAFGVDQTPDGSWRWLLLGLGLLALRRRS